MSVVTRFAPSPTGFLHIGGARTALFNWLFARHHGGKFLLRIEDTDRARSTDAAIAAIIDGLSWLELDWDGEVIHQFSRAARHAEIAHKLVAEGKAYFCYASPEELTEMREKARAEGRPLRYDGRWRDRDPKEAPPGVKPVVRLKAPTEGETVIADLVQGEVRVANIQLDDMVLLRSDGTPTYMLSVVVDDHDMGISHIIRGDDHLTNAFRQKQLYDAAGFAIPNFAHIPLIHGPDGAKLSKRHGALGVDAYRDMGYLPEAVCNYLLRLGWSHGDDETMSRQQAIAWFGLESVGRSAARFDFAKLANLNAHYLKQSDDERLVGLTAPLVGKRLGFELTGPQRAILLRAMTGLKERAKTLVELADAAVFLFLPRPVALNDKAAKILGPEVRARLGQLAQRLKGLDSWDAAAIEATVRDFAAAEGLKLGDAAQPIRAAVSGSNVSPPIFEVLAILGRDESLGRLADVAQ